MYQDRKDELRMKKSARSVEERMENHEKKESFWKYLSKILCSLAMFNALNKHY